MKALIVSISILAPSLVFGQSEILAGLWKLYQSRKYDKVIEAAKPHLDTDSLKVELSLLLGRTYADRGDFRLALPYLYHTAENDRLETSRKGWALGYLGHCHFMLEEYADSEKAIKECLDLNATRNSAAYAYRRLQLFGFSDDFNDWKIVESDNFRFHFQDMSEVHIERFVSSREMAFKSINEFFQGELPKKIDFFAWTSREAAQKLFGRNLGFSEPRFCIVHSHYRQTIGHEIAHVISHYSTKVVKKTGLINEGTAVYFDQTNQDRAEMVKEWIKANGKRIRIVEVWEDWKDYPEEFTYPLSGLFVGELIDSFGREKFIEFFSDQTYRNAKAVFGHKLDKVIKELEEKINV